MGDSGHVGTAANGKVALWQANEKDGEFSEQPMRRLHEPLWLVLKTMISQSGDWKWRPGRLVKRLWIEISQPGGSECRPALSTNKEGEIDISLISQSGDRKWSPAVHTFFLQSKAWDPIDHTWLSKKCCYKCDPTDHNCQKRFNCPSWKGDVDERAEWSMIIHRIAVRDLMREIQAYIQAYIYKLAFAA